MPDFFDLTNLPEEKSLRWESAATEYARIQKENIDRELSRMTIAQKEALLETFPRKTFTAREALALSHATQGGEGSPKSALFARLLSGSKALPMPPPLYFSYPWYDIFDKKSVHEVHVKIDRSTPTPRIFIGELLWDFARQEKPGRWIVTTGAWALLSPPVTWVLKHTRLPAEVCKAYIACWHNPNIRRVTTLNQLKAEVTWHVNQRHRSISALLKASPEEVFLARNKSLHAESLRQKKIDPHHLGMLQQGLYLVDERRKAGLPDAPSLADKAIEVSKTLSKYFTKNAAEGHFKADSEGKLWRHSWSMERLPSAFLDVASS